MDFRNVRGFINVTGILKNGKLIKPFRELIYKMGFNPFGIFKRSEVRDLLTLKVDIEKIQNRVKDFQAFREKLLERIRTSCGELKNNPTNKKARRTLIISLHGERRFLKLVREGAKEVISILEATLRELRKAKINPKIKAEMLQTIQFLIDTMQFAKGKVKVIERRIKKGEKLEEKDYAGEHLTEFLQTLNEEEEIDRELGLVLQGKSKKVRSEWRTIAKYMVKDEWIRAAGSGTAAAGSAAGYFGSLSITGSGRPPEDTILVIVGTIIAASLGVMYALAKETYDHEESRRKGLGKIGRILKIPK